MFNVKRPEVKLHNEFTLVIKDAKTKKVEKEYKAYNTALLNQYYSLIQALEDRANSGAYKSENAQYAGIRKMYLGRGTGTPAATDTAMFDQIGKYDVTHISTSVGMPLSTSEVMITIGETALVGETLREIGLGAEWDTYYDYEKLISHALFKDSEGTPITVGPKTDTQIYEIYAKTNVEINSALGCDFIWHKLNPYSALFVYDGWITSLDRSNFMFYPTLTQKSAGYSRTGNVITLPGTRLLSTEMNPAAGGIHAIGFGGLGAIRFPNTTYYPAMTFTDENIGTGDGANKYFNLPTGFYVPGTVTVKVDGVAKTEGVDYELQQGARNDNILYTGMVSRPDFGRTSLYPMYITEGLTPPYYDDLKVRLDTIDGPVNPVPLHTNMSQALYEYSYRGGISNDVRDHPWFIDLGSMIKLKDLQVYNARVNMMLTIDVSDDGTNWTNIATDVWYSDDAWRSIDLSSNPCRYIKISSAYTGSSGCNKIEGIKLYPAGNVIFTNPPAADAVITATLDSAVPIKTSDYSYDVSLEVDFT